MSRRPTPVFLERQTYRRRRMMDAARLLPLLGVLLLSVPLLWPTPEAAALDETTAAVPMSVALSYVFAVWALLILLCGLLGIKARQWAQADAPPEDPTDRFRE